MKNELWGFISIFGVWGWISAAVGFILKAFPEKDKFRGREAMIWGGAFVFFYGLWVVAMINA